MYTILKWIIFWKLNCPYVVMTEMVWPVSQFWQMEITLRYLLMWRSEIEIVHYWVAFLCCFSVSSLLILFRYCLHSAACLFWALGSNMPKFTAFMATNWKKKTRHEKKHPDNDDDRQVLNKLIDFINCKSFVVSPPQTDATLLDVTPGRRYCHIYMG